MEKEKKIDEIEINLAEIFALLLDKLPVIILSAILGTVVAFAFTKLLITPQYQSLTQIYVTNSATEGDKAQINETDVRTSTYLTKDYMILIKSRPVLEQVIADMELHMKPVELAQKISVTTPTDTRILTIAVKDSDPMLAQKIADAVREASKKQIQDVMGVEKVNTVEKANLPENPVSPNTKMNVLVGGILGLFLSVMFVIVRYVLDDTIKTQEDVEKYLGVSVLGLIPELEDLSQNKKKKKKKKKASK